MKKSIIVLCSLIAFINSNAQQNLKFKNNLTIKPFNANNIGLGIGIHYERYLDSTNNFSLVFPVNYSFEVANNNYGGGYNNNSFGIDINPGIRFYFVEPRSFNWYIGCSFLYGYENSEYAYYDPVGSIYYDNYTRNTFGSLINVGFKGTIKQRFTYNVEFGNGLKFIDKSSQTTINMTNNSRYMASILAGFGYNF